MDNSALSQIHVARSADETVELRPYQLLRAHQLLEGRAATRQLAGGLAKLCAAWQDGGFDEEKTPAQDTEEIVPKDWPLVHLVQKNEERLKRAGRRVPAKRRKGKGKVLMFRPAQKSRSA